MCWSSFFGSTNGSRVLISRSDATGHLGRRKLHDSGNQAADVSMIICRRSLVNHFSFTFPTCVCCIDVDCIGARCTANHSISFLIWLRRHQAAPNGNSIFFLNNLLKIDKHSRHVQPMIGSSVILSLGKIFRLGRNSSGPGRPEGTGRRFQLG